MDSALSSVLIEWNGSTVQEQLGAELTLRTQNRIVAITPCSTTRTACAELGKHSVHAVRLDELR